jgi:hypothetical protein
MTLVEKQSILDSLQVALDRLNETRERVEQMPTEPGPGDPIDIEP